MDAQRLLLAFPTLCEFGCYDYFPLTLDEAIDWLNDGEFVSTLRSRDMCYALKDLTGEEIWPCYSSETPRLSPGDEALVYHLPLTETIRSTRDMSRHYMTSHFQFGLLKRVDGLEQEPMTEDEKQRSDVGVEQEVYGG